MNILLVDAFNMIHRARHGHDKGEYGIIYTFFRSLRSEVEKHKSDLVFLVTEGKPVRRLAENTEYKANRTAIVDEGFHRQKKKIFDLCQSLPIIVARHPQHECDDVIAHIATKMFPNEQHIICSTDTDFIQIVNGANVNLWNPIKKNFIGPIENYSIWKALRGDKSDNIPGVKGIGDVTATKLASDDKKLQQFLDSDPSKKESFESSLRQILFEDVEHKNIQFDCNSYDSERLLEEFRVMNFNSLIDKSWKKWNQTWTDLEDKCKHHSLKNSLTS